MRIDVVTIFPDFFRGAFEHGIIRRAQGAGLVDVKVHDLRRWTTDKHRQVDDRPFGGGDGMILKPEPIFEAVEALTNCEAGEYPEGVRVVLLSPQGRTFTQSVAQDLAESEHVVLICGRYEGVDE